MASEAQIQAHRANAQKSTGPRTAEGKAVVARNAIQHGLTAGLDVIPGEDREQFEQQRAALLEELRPGGMVEEMLAERVVGLSWRLQRVGRLQNEVFEALLAGEAPPPAEPAPSQVAGQATEEDGLARGRAVLKDFATGRVLDRLLLHERRIENSLFKTLRDLRQRGRESSSRQRDENASEPVRSVPVRASPGGANVPARPDSVVRGRTSPDPVGGRLYEETPDGVTTSAPRQPDAGRMSATRVPHHSSIPLFQHSIGAPGGSAAAGLLCKTKPICPEAKEGQVLCGAGVRENVTQDVCEKTKPISAWQAAPAAELINA